MKIKIPNSIEHSLEDRKLWFIPLFLWGVLVSASLYQSITSIQDHSWEVATESARNISNIIRLTRHWNAISGGIYMPITEKVQPNPYLDIPDRDVVTKDNLKLTMINPAYMTRQIAELASQEGATFHITSLRPIRPQNAPEPWEREALKLFEEGKQEYVQYTDTSFRYMAPLMVAVPCLKCHGSQGYQVGDVRGGISVTLPREPIFGEDAKLILLTSIQHGSVFIIVAFISLLLFEQIRRSWRVLDSIRFEQKRVITDRTNALSNINKRLRIEIAQRTRVENLYRLINQVAPEAIISTNSSGVIVSWNHGAESIFGYTEDEMLGEPVEKIIPLRYQADHQEGMERASENAEFDQLVVNNIMVDGLISDGAEVPLEISLNGWQNGQERFFTAVIRDLSEKKRAEEDLRLASKVFDSTSEGLMITDFSRKIIAVNHAFTVITGYTQSDLVDKTPEILQSGRHDRAFYKDMWQKIQEIGSWSGEIWNKRKDGEVFPEWLSINIVRNKAGEVTHYVGIFSDISEMKRSQQQLAHLVNHDPVTDLPNRSLFIDFLKHAIERAHTRRQILAVMIIDLDNYKDINDSLGHTIGDQLLRFVSQRIVETLRTADTVARLGGDSFIVLLENVEQISSLEPMVEKLSSVLQQNYNYNQQKFYISTSIGLSCFPGDGQNDEELINHASAAMYTAKEDGRNRFMFYNKEMTSIAHERLQIEGSLRRALTDIEFILYYQPQIDARTGEVAGVEALIRWFHPEMGEVSPIVFIPRAEYNGLIIPVGAWVLRQACQQIMDWQNEGLSIKHISVNVAGPQIRDSNFYNLVVGVLEETGMNPEILELEVTESFIMQRAERAIGTLEKIKALGVQVSIDDFGTGYSALSSLKLLPIDRLKIDRSFVRDLTIDPNDVAITKAIIALSKSLGLSVIAEGIETPEQEKLLMESGCNYMQGFLYSRPIPANEMAAFVNKQNSSGRSKRGK